MEIDMQAAATPTSPAPIAPPTTPGLPPSAGELARQFVDLHRELARYDANFTQWQSRGNVYPSIDVAAGVRSIAYRFDDARLALRDLRPSATELHRLLQADVLKVAADGGQLSGMAQSHSTFGSGWSRSFDTAIRDVAAAIDLLIGTARPAA
jgi:hypothetical protein